MNIEHFVHKTLEARAQAIVKTARETWRRQRKIKPYAVTWPGESLKSDSGEAITHAVFCALPVEHDVAKRMGVLQQLIERTKAYGIVVVEQRDSSIRILFETRYGACAWCIPLVWHGDVQVPGQTEVSTNGECVGLLWRRGSSPH
jgi:hypothetical protein